MSGQGNSGDPFRTRWYYAGSEDSEHWWVGGETREQAIEKGRAEHGSEGFWVTAGSPMKHNLDVFDDDLDPVISAFQTKNEDMFGEDGQGDPEVEWTLAGQRDLARRLNETFAAWARENGYEKAYNLDLSHSEEVPANAPATQGRIDGEAARPPEITREGDEHGQRD